MKLLYFFPLLVFVFFAFPVSATVVDDFEYTPGALHGNGGWDVYNTGEGPSHVVTTDYSFSGSSSIYATTTSAGDWLSISTTTYAMYHIRFYAPDSPAEYNYFSLLNYPNNTLSIGVNNSDNVYFTADSTTTNIGVATWGSWHKLSIEFDASNHIARARYDDNPVWTEIIISPTFDGINYLLISNSNTPASDHEFYWDYLISDSCTETCTGCSSYQSCTAQSGCYFNFVSGSCYADHQFLCGPVWNTQYCVTEASCALAGGYWIADYCFQHDPTIPLTPWAAYYASNSDYATATVFVQYIASSTSGFYNMIRGFATSFGHIFNASSATAYGSSTGSVIPQIRGYLGQVNGVFNNLPVAEIFLFSLMLLFGSIVWQIVKGIIGIIKFF